MTVRRSHVAAVEVPSAAYSGSVSTATDQPAPHDGATVFAFEPFARFLQALRAHLPVEARAATLRCFHDEEGDGHVELVVPDTDWEQRLSERMAPVTLAILDDHGAYVGLVACVDKHLSAWKEPNANLEP